MHFKNLSLSCLGGITTLLFVLNGCSTQQTPAPEPTACLDPQWTAFAGNNGQEVTWESLTNEVLSADIIVVGEQHDNAAGHELERRLVSALLERHPQSAVAMEMFERNEQAFVDLYLDGRIQAKTLVKITDSADWGGSKGAWWPWYQPIVDCVKDHRDQGAGLKAANCPRCMVKLARLEGFEVFAELDEQTASLVTLPAPDVNDAAYRDRFTALMNPGMPARPASPMKSERPSSMKKPGSKTMDAMSHVRLDPEAFFRAQQTWDASMAASVLDAQKHHPKVMLLVGEFHMAHDGGLIQRLRHANPRLKIASISIVKDQDPTLKTDDLDRAEFVVYTH